MEFAQKAFYQAGNLGEGGYGSVCRLFDDDGAVFAGKTFGTSESSGESRSSGNSSSGGDAPTLGLDTGVLREMAFFAAQQSIGLKHPNILPAECVTRVNGEVCVVLPQMQRSLEDVIEKKEWLSNPDRLRVVKQVLGALSHMHDHGFMHRDVKPANVLLDAENNACLCDFSLVKPTNLCEADTKGKPKPMTSVANGHTRGSGTATYIAPEVVNGDDYGTKADAYSAGVVMYELLNNTTLQADSDKHALREVEGIRGRLSQIKLIPKVMAALLDPSAETRISCAEALLLLDNHQVASSVAAEKLLVVPQCSGKSKDLNKAFNQMGCQSLVVLQAAARLHDTTEANPAVCVFLAHKLLDTELIDGLDLVECDQVDGLDDGYPQAEMALLELIQFDLYGVVSRRG